MPTADPAAETAWRERFRKANAKVLVNEAELEAARAELKSMDEQAAAGGAGYRRTTESLARHQQLRDQLERGNVAKRELEELHDRASMAYVPQDWR